MKRDDLASKVLLHGLTMMQNISRRHSWDLPPIAALNISFFHSMLRSFVFGTKKTYEEGEKERKRERERR